jgi:hypothetical protein
VGRPADPDAAEWNDVVEASIAHLDSGVAARASS